MKASDVMSRSVITVGPNASVLEAATLMLQNKISGLPVVDSLGHLVGILTEGDFLRRAETGTEHHRARWLEFFMGPGRPASEYVHSHGRKVEELMTHDPHVVAEDTPLEEVVQLMEQKHIKRVPVVREGKVVGIISRQNLVQALTNLIQRDTPLVKDDSEIRDRVLAELDAHSWTPLNLTISVQDGTVDLSGIVTDERQRQALKVAVENIPGVKAVHDRLVWVEPMSGAVMESPEEARARATR